MSRALGEFLALSWPPILGICLFALAFLPKRFFDKAVPFKISILDILAFEKEFSSVLARAVLMSLAIVSFSVPALRDYSEFFPKRYKMIVFFDDEGIMAALGQFTDEELKDFRVKKNWRDDKRRYLEILNKQLAKEPGMLFRFDEAPGRMYANGQTTFKVEKVGPWGLQQYQIKEAKGSLTHYYNAPGQTEQELYSEFDLLETEANRINANLADVYLRFRMVLRPEFRQIFRRSQREAIYDHSVAAVTPIRFFPYIDVGRTIYLYRRPDGQRVPIGYAIYSGEED